MYILYKHYHEIMSNIHCINEPTTPNSTCIGCVCVCVCLVSVSIDTNI